MPFVTFEGVEGSGKTTQLRLAASRLRSRGLEVVETREPGGTPIGAKVRAILMDASHSELDPIAEWLLLEADRRQHVRELLEPALARGSFVLCDRYCDATEAYQQAGRGLDPKSVKPLDELVRGGLMPDLTLLYDLDPEEGLRRARDRDGEGLGRFEAADLDFHKRVRRAYLEIAKRESRRIAVVAGSGPAERLFEETWRVLAERFSL